MDNRLSENLYDRIYRKKKALFQQFAKGDLTKREFLIENFELIQNMNIKPFNNVDCFEKGFYNYQYYNTLAKYYRMEAEEAKNNMKHPEMFREFTEKSDYFYSRKDRTILRVLEVINYKNVDAYYIKVKSPFLRNKLIEIVLRDYDNVIFHSKSSWLVERLFDEGILYKGEKKSLIDLYINQKY